MHNMKRRHAIRNKYSRDDADFWVTFRTFVPVWPKGHGRESQPPLPHKRGTRVLEWVVMYIIHVRLVEGEGVGGVGVGSG
jgi:hypothetical protein